MSKIAELREKMVKAVHDGREIINRAERENRPLTSEEQVQFDAHNADADAFEAQIETISRRETIERRESAIRGSAGGNSGTRAANRVGEDRPNMGMAFRAWMTHGLDGFDTDRSTLDNAARCGMDLSQRTMAFDVARRSMGVGATPGSNLRTYTELYDVFEKELRYYASSVDLVTTRETSTGADMPIPVVDDTNSMAAIIADSAAVGQLDPAIPTPIVLRSFKYSSLELALSFELLQDAQYPIEGEVGAMLAERFGRKWNRDITIGVGTTEPHSLCSRSAASGVVAGGTNANPTFASPDLLFDLTDSVDLAYQAAPGVGYMMHQVTRSKLRKLKDSTGQYLWQPSVQVGVPSTFNGFPVYINPDMPQSGSSAAIILFGDYKQYIWRRVAAIQFFRNQELRILNGLVSFVAFARADGNLKKPNAVKKLVAPA